MPEVDLERLRKIESKLPRLDYFQILNIGTTANDSDIKNAFRKRSAAYHPDRFFKAGPDEKKAANQIFKQISAAYNAIKQSSHRKIYLKQLEKDRVANIRFNPAKARVNVTGEMETDKQTGPGAKYYDLTLAAIAEKDFRSASNNIKLALMMEAGNEVFKALQEKISAKSS